MPTIADNILVMQGSVINEFRAANAKALVAVTQITLAMANTTNEKSKVIVEIDSDDSWIDGPSVRAAVAAALLSLAFNKPIKNHFMITGTVSINGRIGAIGGCLEKHAAATVSNFSPKYPQSNEPDLQNHIGVTYISNVKEMIDLLFS